MKNSSVLALDTNALNLDDPDRRVSSRSRWHDDVWRLDGGGSGTDPGTLAVYWPAGIHARLLEEFRRLLWSTYVAPQDQQPPSELTISTYGNALRPLARWMDAEGYGFEHVDREFGRHLHEHLTQLVDAARDDEYDAEGKDDDDVDDEQGFEGGGQGEIGPPSFTTVAGMMRITALIHAQRHVLRRMGIDVPDDDPLEGRTAWACALDIRTPDGSGHPPLPNEVARPLMIATDRLVAGGALDDVLELQRLCLLADEPFRGPTASKLRHRDSVLADATRDFRFSILPGETEPWHPGAVDRGEGRPASAAMLLGDLIRLAQTICGLLILQLTGMRPGELLALRAGFDDETGLPTCVERVSGPSGTLTLYYAVGTVKKGRSVPEEARWLLGAVPAGTNSLPTTVLALITVERLNRPWRENSTDSSIRDPLLLNLALRMTPNCGSVPTRFTGSQLRLDLLAVYPRLMDLGTLPTRSSEGVDLTPYRRLDDEGRRAPLISPVQWRKTFATMLSALDGRLAKALTRHFQHLRAATLDASYVSSDTRLLEIMAGSRAQTVMDVLAQRIDGEPPKLGRGGRILERNVSRTDRLVREAEHADGASTLAEIHAPSAWLGEHADCAFFVAPHRAACHEAGGSAHYLNERPDFSFRTPETCLGCPNAVLRARHLDYWRTRFLEANAAKRSSSSPRLAALMQERARTALRVHDALRRNAARREERV